MYKRKMVCAVLLVLLTLTNTSACGEMTSRETASDTRVDHGTGTETVVETEDPALMDSLPDEDLGGYIFRMTLLGTDIDQMACYVDGQDGNIVNDAVYDKIKTVEERFNVDIVMTEESKGEDNVDVIRQNVMAGDDSCDIAQGHDISMANAAMEGLFYNVYDIPNLDFTKPWWPKETLESMTVAEQMYMMFNNISYVNLASMRVMYFNKTLLSNLDIPYPYEEVLAGTWTMDRLLEIVEEGYSDLNGNSSRDENDRYGFVNPPYYYCWMEPFQVEPYQKDADGNLIYEVDLERLTKVTEKYYDLLFGNGGYLVKTGDANAMFSEGRSLFRYATLSDAVHNYSNSEVIYGIVPMPKLDEKQDQYYSGSTDRPIAVPITAEPNIDTIGIVVEALNAEGYKRVYPAYYEVAMKSRYADQTEDAQMLDIVHENTIISFTYLYGNYASIYNIMLENLFNKSPSTDVASWCAKQEKRQTRYVASLMEFFQENRE